MSAEGAPWLDVVKRLVKTCAENGGGFVSSAGWAVIREPWTEDDEPAEYRVYQLVGSLPD